jgi:hypothetical protein
MKRTGLVFLIAVLLVPWLAAAATRVSSNSDCPASDAISVRLLGLLAAGGPESATALVTTDGASMRIEVSTPGESPRVRAVPLTGECNDRAEMAALVIASWLDAMPVGTIKTTGYPQGDGEVAGDIDDPRIVMSTRKRFGVGAFGLADKDGTSAGVSFELGMPKLFDVFGWMAHVRFGLPRTLAVGQGDASYWRPTLGLAITGEILSSAWVARVHLGPELGVLAVSGRGYAQNRSETAVTWGADVGLTIARAFSRKQLWLRIEGVLWPVERNIRSSQVPSGPDIVVPLSAWETRLAAGYAWGAR